ncbi:DUF226 domain-containing protein [Borrelia persica]|uniref:DUF226 domain-containing protein n=1 Tax=Borrelia persica TaxID=44448 RepID=UPI000467875A|nr:DUF226 domain-containing protein [Borrelia persica]
MNCSLKSLKNEEKKIEFELKPKKKDVFSKVMVENNRTIYHTKIFNDFFTFGTSQKEEGKFIVILRELFNKERNSSFHLFRIKENVSDKFIGMFYGFKRLKKPIYFKYETCSTQIIETTPIYKVYYIEFRFKKGSIFCYIRAIYALTKKEKFKKNYVYSLLERIIKLENEVYKFYNKKLPKGGIINRWIEKNQK